MHHWTIRPVLAWQLPAWLQLPITWVRPGELLTHRAPHTHNILTHCNLNLSHVSSYHTGVLHNCLLHSKNICLNQWRDSFMVLHSLNKDITCLMNEFSFIEQGLYSAATWEAIFLLIQCIESVHSNGNNWNNQERTDALDSFLFPYRTPYKVLRICTYGQPKKSVHRRIHVQLEISCGSKTSFIQHIDFPMQHVEHGISWLIQTFFI